MSLDWSTAKTTLVDTGFVFWPLFDEMVRDGSGFVHNRETLVDAFRNDKMYCLRLPETDALFADKDSRDHPWFMNRTRSIYALPVVAVTSGEEDENIDILWVHSRCRRAGFGRMIVQQLGIKRAPCVMEDTLPFWKALGSVEIGRVVE
nr:hypothetical protein TetV2_00614 [Oceanusvirus sp.]